ncbi:hypothetical protein ABIB57_005317 [Devosia sp. UYZn731]
MPQIQKPPSKAVIDEDPDHSPMTRRGPDGRAHKTPETEPGESVPKRGDDLLPNPSTVRTNPD